MRRAMSAMCDVILLATKSRKEKEEGKKSQMILYKRLGHDSTLIASQMLQQKPIEFLKI
jgi:hypothetical protein